MERRTSIMTAVALMLLFAASVAVVMDSDESDALTDLGNWGTVYGVTGNDSSMDRVYTDMYDKFANYLGKGTFYVKIGSQIHLSGDSDGYCLELTNDARTHGLSDIPDMNWGAVGGTVTQAGSFSVIFQKSGDTTDYEIQFYAVDSVSGDGTVHTMTFDDGTGAKWSMSVMDGSEFELPTNVPGFSNPGHYLKGWSMELIFGSAEYYGAEVLVALDDMEFVAIWAELPSETSDSFFDDSATSEWVVGEKYVYRPIVDGVTVNHWWDLVLAWQGQGFRVDSAPDWLTVTCDSIGRNVEISGTPTIGGNYLVSIIAETNNDVIWWMIHIPSASDSNVTVTYDTGTEQTISPTTVPVGSAVTLPSKGSLTRTGYILLGWQIPDGKGGYPIYLPGGNVTVTDDITAKAYWLKESDVVVYISNGRIVGHDIVSNGEGMNLKSSLDDVPSGYRFLGWMEQDLYDCAYAPGLFMETSGSRYMVAYLVSSDTPTYTVTFDADGGSVTTTSQEAESGIYIYLPRIMASSPQGKVFAGWSTERGGDVLGVYKYLVRGDVTLYAVWEDAEPTVPEETYRTVWFNANGGSGSFASQTVVEGSLLYDPGKPTRDGYAFVGWTTPIDNDIWSFNTDTVTTDMILSAKWEQHFTVSVDGLKVTVEMCKEFSSYQSCVYFGMPGSETNTVAGKASYTFTGGAVVKITVSTTVGIGSGTRLVTSSMPVAIVAPTDPEQPDPNPDPNPSDPDDPSDPEPGREVIPKPFFTVKTVTEGTWLLDATGSTDVKVYRWYVDNRLVHTSSDDNDITYTLTGLAPGKHTVRLEAESATGNVANAAPQNITVPGEEQDPAPGQGDDVRDYSTYILIVVIVLFILGLLVVFR